MNGNPATGISYFLEGFKLLNKPGIRLFVLIPLIINITIFSAASYYGFQYFDQLLDRLLSTVPSWLSFIEWILWPLFFLTAGSFIFFLFNIIANLVASPFNGLLAEAVEKHLENEDAQSSNQNELQNDANTSNLIAEVAQAIPASLAREVHKMKYYLPRFIGLTLLFFIPGINILVFLFASWMMAIQYLDYPMDNHKFVFKDMLAMLRSKRLTSLGFGAIVMFCLMVPILNFVVIPAAVAGSSVFWLREFKKTARQAS